MPRRADRPPRRTPAERNALIAGYYPLVHRVVGRLLRASPRVALLGAEAATDAGFDGLIAAGDRWDESRGVKFVTLAHPYIRGYVLSAAERHGRRRVPTCGLDDETAFAGLARRRNGEPLPAAPRPPRLDDEGGVWALAGRLRAREREVLRLRYRDGLTLAAAGRALGVTKERVRQIEQAALGRLRELLGATAAGA